jgi:hypothetical protein
MVDQSTGSGSDSAMGRKTPDELITHGKQIFGALGKLDRNERDQVFREWRNDPATANVFSELMESTG